MPETRFKQAPFCLSRRRSPQAFSQMVNKTVITVGIYLRSQSLLIGPTGLLANLRLAEVSPTSPLARPLRRVGKVGQPRPGRRDMGQPGRPVAKTGTLPGPRGLPLGGLLIAPGGLTQRDDCPSGKQLQIGNK